MKGTMQKGKRASCNLFFLGVSFDHIAAANLTISTSLVTEVPSFTPSCHWWENAGKAKRKKLLHANGRKNREGEQRKIPSFSTHSLEPHHQPFFAT